MGNAESDTGDFAANFEAAFARLQVALLEACARERAWPRRAAAAVRAGLELAAADHAAAQTLTSESLAHGRDGIARRERLIAYLDDLLRRGREERPDGERLPESTERALAGGVLGLVAQRVDLGRADELTGIVPEVVQFVLTPYLGGEEARRVGSES